MRRADETRVQLFQPSSRPDFDLAFLNRGSGAPLSTIRRLAALLAAIPLAPVPLAAGNAGTRHMNLAGSKALARGSGSQFRNANACCRSSLPERMELHEQRPRLGRPAWRSGGGRSGRADGRGRRRKSAGYGHAMDLRQAAGPGQQRGRRIAIDTGRCTRGPHTMDSAQTIDDSMGFARTGFLAACFWLLAVAAALWPVLPLASIAADRKVFASPEAAVDVLAAAPAIT